MAQNRIVLVEDNQADVWLLQECLDSVASNYELIIINDGEDALRFIQKERESDEQRSCVIVIDLHMPKHDGLEILAAIRRSPALDQMKALIVSTTLSLNAQRQIQEHGVDYAEKPSSLSGYHDLAKIVWQMCESKFHVAA